MKILLGTTNPSKVKQFERLLEDYPVEFITPHDLCITAEPVESGSTPTENAVIKAKFYGQYCDCVICADSGLYFDALPLDDPRQPGLHVRSPYGCSHRLDDDEMIAYYTELIRSLGGKTMAYYLNGYAVYHDGGVHTHTDDKDVRRRRAFYMTDTPSEKRHPGWPLDSISIHPKTGRYFIEQTGAAELDLAQEDTAQTALVRFLADALALDAE